jgi:hypothetical protein
MNQQISRMVGPDKSIGTKFLDSQKPGKSSGQQILLPSQNPPPQINRPRKEKVTTILCNSRERNVVTFPNVNRFRWRLRRDLKDITSIRLIGGNVPGNIYNINEGWQKFSFSENAIIFTVTLNRGLYDGTSLAIELARALNAVSGIANVYGCTYSNTSMALTIKRISGIYSFSLLFQSGQYTDSFDDFSGVVDSLTNDYLSAINTPARLMGFVTQDYEDINGVIVAPNPIDTAWFLNKIFLHINTETDKEFNRVEIARGPHDPYTIIYLDQLQNGIKHLNKETDYPIIEFSPAPLSRLSLLEISMRDEFYRLLDLNNKEFTLLLEITYLE